MNLVFHIDASIENSTTEVSSIDNLSPLFTSSTFSQSNQSLRPELSSSIQINNLNTLVFNSDELESDSGVFSSSPDSLENFSLFAVYKPLTLSNGVFIEISKFIAALTDSNIAVYQNRWKVLDYPGIVNNQEVMIEVEYLGSQDVINFYCNSHLFGSLNIDDSETSENIRIDTSSATIKIGGDSSHFALGEIFLIDSSISKEHRLFIEGYLSNKWGLLDSLPDDHIHHGALSSSHTSREDFLKLEDFSKDFSPNSIINNVVQWYDASDISGSDGAEISTVQDKSKNNLDLVSKNPSGVTLKVGGKGGINLNLLEVSNTFLETVPNETGQTSLRLETTENGNLCCVGLFYLDENVTNRFQSLFSYDGDPNAANSDFQISLWPSTTNVLPYILLDNSLQSQSIKPSDQPIASGNWFIISSILNFDKNQAILRINGEEVSLLDNVVGEDQVWVDASKLSVGYSFRLRMRLKNPKRVYSSSELYKYTSQWITLTGDGSSTFHELLISQGYADDIEFTVPTAHVYVLGNGEKVTFRCGRLAAYTDFLLFANRSENLTIDATLAEFISTDLVSSKDIVNLEGYLAHKWGQSSLLPNSHYFKLNKPKSNDSANELVDVYILSGGSNALGNGGSQQGLTNSLQQDNADRYDSKSNNWLHLNYTQNDILFECRYNETSGRSDTPLLRKVDPDSGGGPGNLIPSYTHSSSSRFGIEIPFLDFINHYQPNRVGLVKYALEDAYISDFDKGNSRITKLQSDPVVGDFVEILHTLDNLLTKGDIAKIFSIDSGNNKITLVEASYSNGTWSTGGSDYSLEASSNTSSSFGYTFTGSDENGSFNDTDDNPGITMTLGDTLTIDLSNLSSHPLEIRDVDGNTVATEDSDRIVRFAPTTASGDYYYICTSHPSSMRGTINVQTNSNVSFNEYALDARGCHWESKANAWDRLVKSIDGFYTSLTQNGFKVNWKGFIWAQGETEFGNTNYYNQLDQLLSNIRSHVGDTELPVKIVKPAGYASNSSGASDAANLSAFNGYLDNIADDSAFNEVVEFTNHSNNAVSDSFTQDSNSQYTILRGNQIFDLGKNLANSFGSFDPSHSDKVFCWYNLKDSSSRTLDSSNNLTALDNLISSDFNLTSNADFGNISFDSDSQLAKFQTNGSTDSSSTRLTTTTAINSSDINDFTIFAVLKTDFTTDSYSAGNYNDSGVFFNDSNNLLKIQYPYFSEIASRTQFRLITTYNSNSITNANEAKRINKDVLLHILSISRNSKLNSSAYNSVYEIRINGILIDTIYRTDTMTYSPGNRLGAGGFHIGGGTPFYLGEFLIAGGTLSDSERESIEGYLAHNWSISQYLNTKHKFHKSRPTK